MDAVLHPGDRHDTAVHKQPGTADKYLKVLRNAKPSHPTSDFGFALVDTLALEQ